MQAHHVHASKQHDMTPRVMLSCCCCLLLIGFADTDRTEQGPKQHKRTEGPPTLSSRNQHVHTTVLAPASLSLLNLTLVTHTMSHTMSMSQTHTKHNTQPAGLQQKGALLMVLRESAAAGRQPRLGTSSLLPSVLLCNSCNAHAPQPAYGCHLLDIDMKAHKA